MPTLSFDLRGFGAEQTPRPQNKRRGAGVSFFLHGVFLSALVLAPLLGASNPPEAVDASNDILIQPISVALPPPPMTASHPARDSTKPPLARALVVEITAPPNVPVLNLDAMPDPGIESDQQIGFGRDGAALKPGGDCPLGTMCGDGPLPLASPIPETPRVGGLIKEPRLLGSHPPQYPQVAQQAGISGRVVIEAYVGRDGLVGDCRIVERNRLFDEAALTSVRSRRYKPLLLNGVPSDFLVTITVVFNLRR